LSRYGVDLDPVEPLGLFRARLTAGELVADPYQERGSSNFGKS
jgi:hypothetical protein